MWTYDSLEVIAAKHKIEAMNKPATQGAIIDNDHRSIKRDIEKGYITKAEACELVNLCYDAKLITLTSALLDLIKEI